MSDKSTLPNYKWIKFGIDYLDDPDFMGLSDRTTGAFIKLYLLAGKADAGGLLCNGNKVFSLNDLAWTIRCEQPILKAAVDELLQAGLLAPDGDGYKLTRFLDEQGPGDNEQREAWRERQSKKRARARKETEPEKEEEEEREVEVDLESHADVTVTPPPAPSFPSSVDVDIFQQYWKAYQGHKLAKAKMAEFFEVIHEKENQELIPDWSGRLRDCLAIWKVIVEEHNTENPDALWSKNNPDAIMELFPLPALEERMQRENRSWTDAKKKKDMKATLKFYGLLEE